MQALTVSAGDRALRQMDLGQAWHGHSCFISQLLLYRTIVILRRGTVIETAI